MSWNQFLDMIGSEPERKQIYKSPIPPGYFKDLDIQTISVTGEEEKDGGCKSTVGGSMLTAIAAAATVIGLCKKKKE